MSEKEISEKMQDIMSRMKKRREELDMSYQTLSDKVGISKSTLQRYETGYIKNMPVDKLEDIANALQVSPAYLMGWSEEVNEQPTTLDTSFERAEILRALMEEKGMKVSDIVKISGLPYSTVKAILERGAEKAGYVKRTDSREDRRAKKISLTSEGMFFIQRLTLAQSMYLKEIWDYLTHDEQELFEVINKKLLAHFSDASS